MPNQKTKADRDCERSCNSLFVPGFKYKYGHKDDPTFYPKAKDKPNRECCFFNLGCWFG